MERGDIELAIQMLLDESEGKFDDPYALHHRVMETIHTLEAEGMPVPGDLVALRRDLETVMGSRPEPSTDDSDPTQTPKG